LLFQICGLIGPAGILPTGEYLQAVAEEAAAPMKRPSPRRLWFYVTRRLGLRSYYNGGLHINTSLLSVVLPD
jgi:hypothetical protein